MFDTLFGKAILVFAGAAGIGVYMAFQHSRGKTPPPAIAAAIHGILAVTGVVLLLVGIMQSGVANRMYSWALGLFIAAALGGLYLVSHHFRGRPLPGTVIAIHGVVAVTAFVILAIAVFALG